MTKRTFENKTALITGADGGIGTALIRELIKEIQPKFMLPEFRQTG